MQLSFAYVVIFKFVKMTRGFSWGYFKLLLEPERGFFLKNKAKSGQRFGGTLFPLVMNHAKYYYFYYLMKQKPVK